MMMIINLSKIISTARCSRRANAIGYTEKLLSVEMGCLIAFLMETFGTVIHFRMTLKRLSYTIIPGNHCGLRLSLFSPFLTPPGMSELM